jgi:zinc transport system ATP-binding protein
VTEALLELDAVVAGYEEAVVGPLSFLLESGEIVGLAGPSGSGKSTILRAIIGSARVFAGSVRRRKGLRVAIQSQSPTRLGEMPITGTEFLRLTAADRQAVPAPLSPLLSSRLDRLSGGQYQLLNVWACLGSAADLVLLDEPTNNMDGRAQSTLVGLLRASREERRAVLVISHEHDFLESVCTRLVELQR